MVDQIGGWTAKIENFAKELWAKKRDEKFSAELWLWLTLGILTLVMVYSCAMFPETTERYLPAAKIEMVLAAVDEVGMRAATLVLLMMLGKVVSPLIIG